MLCDIYVRDNPNITYVAKKTKIEQNQEKKVEDWYRSKEMMNADSDKLISFMFCLFGQSNALNVQIMPSHMLDGWKASRVPQAAEEPTDSVPLRLSAD